MTPYLVRLKTKLHNARKRSIISRYYELYNFAYDCQAWGDNADRYQKRCSKWEQRLKRQGLL